MLDRLAQERLAHGMFGAVEFEHRLQRCKRGRRVRRQHGQELQRAAMRDAGAPDMRVAAQAEGGGHVGDLLASDRPPAAQVSGWTMSTRARQNSSRKPKRVNSHSPPAIGIDSAAFTSR